MYNAKEGNGIFFHCEPRNYKLRKTDLIRDLESNERSLRIVDLNGNNYQNIQYA